MRVASVVIGLVLMLGGCASVDTTIVSSASHADIPSSKYHKIIVFIENDEPDRLPFEKSVAEAIRGLGPQADSSLAVFNYSRTRFSPDELAHTIRDQGFDAALYVTVTQKAFMQEPAIGVSVQDQGNGLMLCRSNSIGQLCYSMPPWYSLMPDGQLMKQSLNLAAKAELQDVQTAKLVWAADAALTADGNNFEAMPMLFDKITRQLTGRMQADKAI